MKTTITIEVDTDLLVGYTDQYVAQLWHIAQANPADISVRDATDLVKYLGFEIIRRWLEKIPPELYHHQAGNFEWHSLCQLGAKFKGGQWVMPAQGDADLPSEVQS